jgi:hypothetical protein
MPVYPGALSDSNRRMICEFAMDSLVKEAA